MMDDAERFRIIREASETINAAFQRIRQARLDAGIHPGEPLLWPDGLPNPEPPTDEVTA